MHGHFCWRQRAIGRWGSRWSVCPASLAYLPQATSRRPGRRGLRGVNGVVLENTGGYVPFPYRHPNG